MHPDDRDPAADAAALTIALSHDTTVTRLGLAGELDMASEPMVLATVDQLRSAGLDRVVLDLTRVTFCDARGLAALVALQDRLARGGIRLSVVGTSGHLRRLLAVTGLDRHLDLRADADR
jgi:anti-sigma B factor antagonist